MTTTNIPMIVIIGRALDEITTRERARNFNGERQAEIRKFTKEMSTLNGTLEEIRENLVDILWDAAEEMNPIFKAGDTPDEMDILRVEMVNALEEEISYMIIMENL